MKTAIQEHRDGFWHMSDLEKDDPKSKSRRLLEEKLKAHLRGEYLVKEDIWKQGWMGLVDRKRGWYILKVGKVQNLEYSG
jgi:hypothetical protein